MEPCPVVACDVDGVINIFADDSFIWQDVNFQRIRTLEGNPAGAVTFSPSVARGLTDIKDKVRFIWLTSWNTKTDLLSQLGFPKSEVLNVTKGFEKESKIAHIAELAKSQRVLWIDDCADEWESELPVEIRDNVVVVTPDFHQGISPEQLRFMKEVCGL